MDLTKQSILKIHTVEIDGVETQVLKVEDIKHLGRGVMHPKILPKIISSAMFGKFDEEQFMNLVQEGVKLRDAETIK